MNTDGYARIEHAGNGWSVYELSREEGLSDSRYRGTYATKAEAMARAKEITGRVKARESRG